MRKERCQVKKILVIALSLLVIIGISVGCSNGSSSTSGGDVTYPLTITDSLGEKVTIEKEPEKIVSLSPVITEIVCAVGEESNLVGRTSYCDYPKSVESVQVVGDVMTTNIEEVVALEPDIIIASSIQDTSVADQLKELGYTFVSVASEESYEGAYADIETVGTILNRSGEAKEIVEDMQKEVADIEAVLKDVKEEPTIYYVVGYGEYGDFTAGGDTFIGETIKKAKGKNIAEDSTGWSYSLEQVIAGNPDMLIGGTDGIAGIENATGYKDLQAVKDKKVYSIDEDLINRAGPRLPEGLRAMVEIIHPEAFK